MDKIVIRGGKPLKGEIRVGGAKNAALPLMTACLLTNEPLILDNVPKLADIDTLGTLLRNFGVEEERAGDRVSLLCPLGSRIHRAL